MCVLTSERLLHVVQHKIHQRVVAFEHTRHCVS